MKSLVFVLTTWFVCFLIGVILLVGCTPEYSRKVLWNNSDKSISTTSTLSNKPPQKTEVFLPAVANSVIPQKQSPSFEEIISTPIDPTHLAIKDLSNRLHVETDDIQFVRSYPDEFPASDLGCPESGITPLPKPAYVTGTVIELQYKDNLYTYHVRGRVAAYCGIN